MQEEETQRIVAAAEAAFELRIADRLKDTEKRLTDRVIFLEAKLQSAQQFIRGVVIVAAIFGIAGGWGIKTLRVANQKLAQATKDVTTLQEKVGNLTNNIDNNLEPVADKQIDRIEKVSASAVDLLHKKIDAEVHSALLIFNQNVTSISSARTVTLRSINIINANGSRVISMRGGKTSGQITILNAHSGKVVAQISTKRGDGYLQLYNKNGNELIAARTNGNGGSLYLYNKKNDQAVAKFQIDDGGSGYLELDNKFASPLISEEKIGDSGSLLLFNGSTNFRIAEIGANAEIYGKDGNGYLEIDNGNGMSLFSSDGTGTGGQ